MIWFKLIPVYFAILLLGAHYLRNGDYAMVAFWLLSPFVLAFKRKWTWRVFQLLLLLGAAIWLSTIYSIMMVRIQTGLPWLRMVIILGAVVVITSGSAFLMSVKSIKAKFAIKDKHADQSLAAFIITFTILAIIQFKVSFPIVLADRFLHNLGWLEILLLSLYAGFLVEKMLDVSQTSVWRKRIWLLFSIVFFAQFIIGLLGVDKFLMTGKLHIPVPAVILGGPLYRGGGLFMPILLLSTLILVGPAWCSYLCYIGSWDHRASIAKRKPGSLPKWRGYVRLSLLVATPIVAILLRMLGVSIFTAALFAIGFGVIGVLLMIFWSRKTGLMAHCITWCPIGLLVNWLGKISPFRLRINDACNDCGACTFACRYEALTVADITKRKPGLTCTLCGDCIKRCREDAIEYRFLKLSPAKARSLFLVMVISIHAVFMALARI